ncbi:MAG: PilN domain-containing protein [Oculatellaceae cyanobacterium Prado106]|jgi:type IV pilus assembly protein PilN|nr:PilN domain-containing protein [Oculatellaceae cyanobacterium Prado106]
MYALDINFLKDRATRPTSGGKKPSGGGGGGSASPAPFYAGLVVAIALPALALGAWGFLQAQNGGLEQRQAELDSELATITSQQNEVAAINKQVSDYEADNLALATVFDQIKPWSGILQDIRDRVPNGVQISEILQEAPEAPPVAAATPSPSPTTSPSPGASPDPAAAAIPVVPPPGQPKVKITGRARSFNEVNDFILTLQRSPFLNSEKTSLVSSKLIDNPTQIEFTSQADTARPDVKLPPVVEYTIESSLTDLPASALLTDLERTLSVGLASRIQALRDRGVLKP